jgi:hypothetical protein
MPKAKGEQEGSESSGEKEYEQLMISYRSMEQALSYELEQLANGNMDINESTIGSLAVKRIALDKAEKTISFYLTTKIKTEKDQKQVLALEVQRNSLIKLCEKRQEKEKKLKAKVEELDKPDLAGQFFLPGKWLAVYKEAQSEDIKTLKGEIKKLDKVAESKVSSLPPDMRLKLKTESVRAVEAHTSIEPSGAIKQKPLKEEETKPVIVTEENLKPEVLKHSKLAENIGKAVEYVTLKLASLEPYKTSDKKEETAKEKADSGKDKKEGDKKKIRRI